VGQWLARDEPRRDEDRLCGKGNLMESGSIHYVCIADAHVTADRRPSSDTLTMASGRWAFCRSLPAEDRSR
jgi:hypothetical protein